MQNSIQIQINITPIMLEDIVTTAFEGGINYWCHKTRYTGDSPPLPLKEWWKDEAGNEFFYTLPEKPWEYRLYDAETNEPFDKTLTEAVLVNGIQQYANWCVSKGRPFSLPESADFDAEIADSMVQFAIFGELVYG